MSHFSLNTILNFAAHILEHVASVLLILVGTGLLIMVFGTAPIAPRKEKTRTKQESKTIKQEKNIRKEFKHDKQVTMKIIGNGENCLLNDKKAFIPDQNECQENLKNKTEKKNILETADINRKEKNKTQPIEDDIEFQKINVCTKGVEIAKRVVQKVRAGKREENDKSNMVTKVLNVKGNWRKTQYKKYTLCFKIKEGIRTVRFEFIDKAVKIFGKMEIVEADKVDEVIRKFFESFK